MSLLVFYCFVVTTFLRILGRIGGVQRLFLWLRIFDLYWTGSKVSIRSVGPAMLVESFPFSVVTPKPVIRNGISHNV